MSKLMLPRHDSIGRALWCIHSLWAGVLAEWQRTHDDRDYWRGIEFDKLAHCTHLIWNALYKVRETVSCQSPYESCQGIHGPGAALGAKDRRAMYALDVIDHVQRKLGRNPDVCLFTLKEETWMDRKIYRVIPGKAETWLFDQRGGIAKSAFRGNDQEYLRAIFKIISLMTREEIVAIGTHQTRENTLEAIEFNVYIHFFQKLMVGLERLEGGVGRTDTNLVGQKSALPSLPQLIDEIKRKASLNKKQYTSARLKIEDAYGGSETAEVRKVASVAMEIFSDPKQIWGAGTGVSEWEGLARKLQNLIDYVGALDAVLSHAPAADEEEKAASEKKAERDYERGVQSIPRIRDAFGVSIPRLPRTRGNSFEWSELRSLLFKIFDSLPGMTKYRASYEKKKANMCCQIG